MVKTEDPIPGGNVHDIPLDLRSALIASINARVTWEDITPLARNEWICWVTSAKKSETRCSDLQSKVAGPAIRAFSRQD
jgi:uncharacterized protein YdeI (YjbR/CyaY-like superfamily)